MKRDDECTVRCGETGSTMLLAVFALFLLTMIGSSLLFLGQNELSMTKSNNAEKRAFHLADSGIEAGRMALLDVNGPGNFGDDLTAAAGDDATLDVDPETLRGRLGPGGNVTLTGAGDDVPLVSPTLLAGAGVVEGHFAAFLTNDPVEGIDTLADFNRRVMITGIGVTAGDAMEVAQAIIEPFPALPSVPTAAMTFLGPPPAFDNGSSGAQSHTGTDCPQGGGTPGLYVPIIGTTGSDSDDEVSDDMSSPETFTSGGLTGGDTVGDLTDPSDPAMAQSGLPPIDPSWLDCDAIVQLVQDLISEADYYCNTDSGTCTTPTGNAGDIVVIDGDAEAGGFDAGLLLVTGQLTYSGNSSWDGIVLVIGEGVLYRSGGGDGQNTGAVILANIDPSPDGPRADKSDWCAGGFGATVFSVAGAGASSMSYCSDVIGTSDPVKTYRVSEFLQR